MTKPFYVSLCAALSVAAAMPVYAGPYDSAVTTTVSSSAEREVIRRQEYYSRAEEAVDAGHAALLERDYEVAFAQFRLALDLLSDSPRTSQLRRDAKEGFCVAGIGLAEQRIAEGRFADAEAYAKIILEDRYVPDCKEAITLLARLEDPEYYNRTITPRFVAKVEEVKDLLLTAKNYKDTGRYDEAIDTYDRVLNLDKYNSAARKGQEEVRKLQSNYAIDARNYTRAKLLWDVDQAWELPVKRFNLGDERGPVGPISAAGTNDEMIAKLNRIQIPQIQFRDATVREAIEFLKQKAYELDPEPDPRKKGVNIVLKLESAGSIGGGMPVAPSPVTPAIPGLDPDPVPSAMDAPALGVPNPSDARITLSLSNIPLSEALRYIANLASLKVKVDPYAVSIVPLSEPTDILVTKEYRVAPTFLDSASAGGDAGAVGTGGAFGGGPAFGAAATTDVTRGGTGISRGLSAREVLESSGVNFPPGASAHYMVGSNRLIVRNTQENMELVDTVVAAISQTVKQVEIEAKFVEITQNNLKELSFDWLLGGFNIPGSDRVFAGGGTSGTAPPLDAANFPFVDPSTGTAVGQSPVTSANRSGANAISSNAIDALLFGGSGATSIAPGVLGLAGVFTDPSFQLVIRALNQKKGVDLLSSPRVTTRSGQRAVIEIIREFRYPTEFDPPQIPQEFSGGFSSSFIDPLTGIVGGGSSSSGSFPVTPTTPTAFETRNTGVTLEVEPIVGPDGYTIDMTLVPQVVEFEGFINYGSPIQTSQPGLLGDVQTVVITDNVINQPVFSTRKVTTSVSVWDGQTVVLGGLMREDVQKVEDKVPLLGDLPLLGRLFRSNVDQHIKRNLIIFVTANLINPAGEPINSMEEEAEVIEMIPAPELSPPILPEVPLFKK